MTVATLAPDSIKADLVARAATDPAFRGRLLASPRATFEAELGAPLPADLEVRIVEETPTTLYLVLPMTRPADELTAHDLGAVSGGLMRR